MDMKDMKNKVGGERNRRTKERICSKASMRVKE